MSNTSSTAAPSPSAPPAATVVPVSSKLNQFAVSAIPPFGSPRAPVNYAQAAATKAKPSPPAVNGKDATATVIGNSSSTSGAASKAAPKVDAVKEADKAAQAPGATPTPSAGAGSAPAPVKAPLDLHSFFGAGGAASTPAPLALNPATASNANVGNGDRRFDTQSRSPQPAPSMMSNLSATANLNNNNHASPLSSASRAFAPGIPAFVPQQQFNMQGNQPLQFNPVPSSPSYQHQQQQQHPSYSQLGKSPAQNIPNGNHQNNNNNQGNSLSGSYGQRSSSFVGSPVMQHQQRQQSQQQLGGNQPRTQFPTSPRSPNVNLPNQQMMYQGHQQHWQPQQQQQQQQPYPGAAQQFPYFAYAQPQQQNFRQPGQAPLGPSGVSTPSGGIRTPSAAAASFNLPPNSPALQSTLANSVTANQFSSASYPISPQQSSANLPHGSMHHPYSSPGPLRSPAPFALSTVANAAEFSPATKRKSAAIKIVNPKDLPPTPTKVAPKVETIVEDPAVEAKKAEELAATKKAAEDKIKADADKAAALAEDKARVAREAAAAVAAKIEADKVEKARLAQVEADEVAARAKAKVELETPPPSSIASETTTTPATTHTTTAQTTPPTPVSAKAAATPVEPVPAAASTPVVAESSVDAYQGTYRYDREFLLQFMAVCLERTEELPNLEAIGMVEGARRASAYMGPPSVGGRGGPASGGFGGGRATSMGQFSGQMGSFGGSGSTSEDRFKQSLAGGARSASSSGGFPARAGGNMSRTSSQSGTILAGANFIPSNSQGGQSRIRSNRGKPRGDERGNNNKPGQHTTGQGFEDAAPLEATANRWTPTVVAGAGALGAVAADADSPEMVVRKVKALLNKLTLEKFPSISEQILAWANKSENESDGRILRQVIALIFEKATDEANWSEMYAQLCRKLMEMVSNKVTDESVKGSDGVLLAGGSLFRKYLLNRCQEDYESGWKQKEIAAAAAAGKAADDNAKKDSNDAADAAQKEVEAGGEAAAAAAAASSSAPKEAELLSDEYYAAQKAKRRGLGLVRFIGELFRLSMLTERIMHECIKKLLSNVENPDEEDIESLCRLLTTVGKGLDTPKARSHMDVYFLRMGQMIDNMKISSRIRFMLQDVVELRREKWTPRHDAAGPKTISEIHSDAHRASEEATRRSASSNGKGLPRLSDQLSRPNSRRGQGRDQYGPPQTSADGWSMPAPQRPAKAGDLTGFGKVREASSSISLGGPSGHFAKGGPKAKEVAARPVTPSNRYAVLEASQAQAAPSQRPRVVYAPRTKPLEGSDEAKAAEAAEPTAESGAGEEEETPEAEEEHDAEEEEDDDGAIDPNAISMSRAEGVRRAGNSVKEFFSVKSLAEGISSVEALPVEYRGILVAAFADAAMDSKANAVALLRSLFTAVVTKELVQHSVFLTSLTPLVVGLIDLAVDVPNAYNFASLLLVGAGITRDEAAELSVIMTSEDEDDETIEEARVKFLAAFDKVQ